jgi:hypothetical protein
MKTDTDKYEQRKQKEHENQINNPNLRMETPFYNCKIYKSSKA